MTLLGASPAALAVYRAKAGATSLFHHRLHILQENVRLVNLRNEAGALADDLGALCRPRHALLYEPCTLQAQNHLVEEALEPGQLEAVLGHEPDLRVEQGSDVQQIYHIKLY